MTYANIVGDKGVFLLDDGIRLLKKIEWAARVSHRSEDKQIDSSWEKFIRFVVVEKGDWSVTEHSSITVEMMVDRGITHELVRHRLFSFTQESTRFVNYEKKLGLNYQCPYNEMSEEGLIWKAAMEHASVCYGKLIKHGSSPQLARSVLPNGLLSKIIVTGNLRNWRHFFIMRTTKEAHPQMKEVTIPLLKEFQEKIPILYEDIKENSRQIDNLKMAR